MSKKGKAPKFNPYQFVETIWCLCERSPSTNMFVSIYDMYYNRSDAVNFRKGCRDPVIRAMKIVKYIRAPMK